jgi:hypothetical protein
MQRVLGEGAAAGFAGWSLRCSEWYAWHDSPPVTASKKEMALGWLLKYLMGDYPSAMVLHGSLPPAPVCKQSKKRGNWLPIEWAQQRRGLVAEYGICPRKNA